MRTIWGSDRNVGWRAEKVEYFVRMGEMMQGKVQIVLHGHMPYVMHHGTWPHGTHWLYEAALEVYLPMLDMLERTDMALTLGMTPVLLTQLRSTVFKDGMYAYLKDQLQRIEIDKRNPDLRESTLYWEQIFSDRLEQFSQYNGDIVSGLVGCAQQGKLEILSSFATHGYAPLLSHDKTIEEQIQVGLSISQSILGFQPRGVWLPECAFAPEREVHGVVRRGVDRILEEAGVEFFYVEDQAFSSARSEGLVLEGQFYKTDWDAVHHSPEWAWRTLLEPHWISTRGESSKIAAFAREPDLCAQLWSAEQGYPGDPVYLEFHKKSSQSGMRHWRVTDRALDMSAKKLYSPQLAQERAQLHAFHFAQLCSERLEHYTQSGRQGILTCCFDAELFGHWWHEGVYFLEALNKELSRKEYVVLETGSAILRKHPPDKVVWIPECSWGAQADHRTWFNDSTAWMWESLHRAEDRYHCLRVDISSLSDARKNELSDIVEQLQWNFLLLQASDWAFVISTKGAVDYGFRRFSLHLERFERLCSLIEKKKNRVPWTQVDQVVYEEIVLHEESPFVQAKIHSSNKKT